MSKEIDEELYNRQLYVLGHDAMRKMQFSNVLIVGMDGLGVEIAKNVILGGVKCLAIIDNNKVQFSDLSSQFYLSENQVGKVTRAQGCVDQLKKLNSHVLVKIEASDFTPQFIGSCEYHVIVAVNLSANICLEADKICHRKGVKFISADVRGLYGSIFVDNGPNFTVLDQDGAQPKTGIISNITRAAEGVVTCSDEHRHGLQTGDYIKIMEVQGMLDLNHSIQMVKVLGPFSFSIDETTHFDDYLGGGVFTQIKTKKQIAFKTMGESLKSPNFIVTDYAKLSSPLLLLALNLALGQFLDKMGRLPLCDDLSESQRVAAVASEHLLVFRNKNFFRSPEDEKPSDARSKLQVKKAELEMLVALSRCSSAILAPMASVIGGITAQEVMKSVTGKFTPINQFLFFDAFECCERGEALSQNLRRFSPRNCRYDSTIAVFGEKFLEKIRKQKVFLVGAGAIGCEMLKNWAMMGLACGSAGASGINVTDMDSIEKSNLNRQFLFRDKDVGELKSKAACDAAKAMNSELQIFSQSNRVGAETEEIYNESFWSSLDIVCNALDNVETRLYVDSKCVAHKKPLFESGTLGTKGNTQVVIPFKTESYGSSRDPPEKSVPMCTLKNFPNKIEHTIQWARDLFEGLFKQTPEDALAFLARQGGARGFLAESSSPEETARGVSAMLGEATPATYEECLRWARRLFEELFTVKILELLFAFPLNHHTSSGAKFWSGPKRPPMPLSFDLSDEVQHSFIISAANLRASTAGVAVPSSPQQVFGEWLLSPPGLPLFSSAKSAEIATTDEEMKAKAERKRAEMTASLEALENSLPKLSDARRKELLGRIRPAEFEKDDSSNFHMDFVTACANLRARNYAIEEVSLHECKRIAGKIIPAIATTTALVSGLVCLEMYKYVLDLPVESFKNGFLSLALPFITFSEPVAPSKQKSQLRGQPWEFSLWDDIVVDEGDITLGQMLKHFSSRLKLKVQILSCDPAIVYAVFSPAEAAKNMDTPLSQLVARFRGRALPQSQKTLTFEAAVEDFAGHEVEIPSVKVRFRK